MAFTGRGQEGDQGAAGAVPMKEVFRGQDGINAAEARCYKEIRSVAALAINLRKA